MTLNDKVRICQPRPKSLDRSEGGFTLIELMIVVAIIAVLSGIVVPTYTRTVGVAKTTLAIGAIKSIQAEIDIYELDNGALPLTLADLPGGPFMDPWGNAYQYLNFSTVKGTGKFRKDKFLVPLNSTYDLYSMGPDGDSKGPLTAKASYDDIIRSNDGDYVGIASSY